MTIAERFVGIDGSFDGPISTPAVAGGSVFALGPLGHLLAVDLETGRVIWRTDLRELVQAPRPHYGFASSPLVAGGVLVMQVGTGSGQAIAGFDLASGALRWTAGKDTIQYQSPALLRLGSRAVDRFLASVKDGPLIDPPDRVVFLYRGDAKDVGIATDLIGVRREDPLHRVPGTDLFFYEAQVEPSARVNYQFVRDFGPPCSICATRVGCRASCRGRRRPRWRCLAGASQGI